jgi:predicted acyl esterase
LQDFYSTAQQPYLYNKDTAMIRMRDGIRLFTVIYLPTVPGKISIYESSGHLMVPAMAVIPARLSIFPPYPAFADMAKDGYIFVFQDIRGKFKSEGKMEMNKPMYTQNRPFCHR